MFNLSRLRHNIRTVAVYSLLPLLLVACAASAPPAMAPGHLQAVPVQAAIPDPLLQSPVLPEPELLPEEERFTVVVNNVPVRELLFALARDANIDIDVHEDITGKVSINAVNQTLPVILERIADQVPVRFERKQNSLIIRRDEPFLLSYKVDYVNMARESNSTVTVATEISTAGGSVNESAGSRQVAGNSSKTTVSNFNESSFWKSLARDINGLLGKSGAVDEAGKINPDVIINSMGGIVTVRATSRQHRLIDQYIKRVVVNAQRQVLIEASIVEVELSDRYQSGVDWQRLAQSGNLTGEGNGPNVVQSLTGANLQTAPFFLLGFNRTTGSGGNLSAAIRLLETFGDVKVLSSPKIMALNNQTALLKVVDEKVYFTVDREEERNADGILINTTYTSEIHTVPVGLVMSVTPQITDEAVVTMNIRPTISRITGYAVDPAARLASGGTDFDNLIPEIQVREMESLLKVGNGATVVLGGLMQNKVNKGSSGVPFFSSLPLIGGLFSYRDQEFTKTELVIFLRPTVVDDSDSSHMAALEQYLSEFPVSEKPAE